MLKKVFLFTVIAFIGITLFANFAKISSSGESLSKVTANDLYEFIAINNILMWVSNNGDGSHDPVTDGNGFYWPGGRRATQSAIFEDGLIWGGYVDGDVRANGNTHRQGIQAGKILPSGDADDPSLDKYRVYKIRKGFRNLVADDLISQEEIDQYHRDYEEWPIEDGAPWVDVNGDGVYNTADGDSVHFVGDEVLWYVANDMDETRSTHTYGKPPIGLEFQTTIFGFNKTGDLGDIVFKKYLVINKGQTTVDDMILAYWSDTDLGDAADDYTGVDTNLVLGYTYNSGNEDLVYGEAPPAVGYDFFQGPVVDGVAGDSAKFQGKWIQEKKNLGLTAFAFYINSSDIYDDPAQGVAEGSTQMYLYLTGRLWNDKPFVDPHTDQEVKFVLSGDPVSGTGWYEGAGWPGGVIPGDRRHLMASGPFQLAPGDSQEIVVGLIIARGRDNINSITKLKRKDRAAQNAYNFDFIIPDSPPPPKMSHSIREGKATIYWEKNAENYASLNYRFEGYRVWQFADELGDFDRAKLLGTYDLENGVEEILDLVAFDDLGGFETEIPVIVGNDDGLIRAMDLEIDAFTGQPFYNDRDYYFGVTAYGYDPKGIPPVLEGQVDLQIIRMGTNRVDVTYPLDKDDYVMPVRVAGGGDPAGLRLQILDPEALIDADYQLSITDTSGQLAYTLVRKAAAGPGDTLISARETPVVEFPTGIVTDGFALLSSNPGQDSLDATGLASAIKNLEQTKRANGVELSDPLNVAGQPGSNGNWRILGLDEVNQDSIIEASNGILKALNWKGKAGQDVYEIRFTTEEEGSEYYLTGYQKTHNAKTAAFNDDPKAAGKVPFQIWFMGPDLGDTSDDQRLIIKIQDEALKSFEVIDSTWSQFGPESVFAGKWETVFAIFPPDSLYPDVLPETSGLLNRPLDIHKLGNIVFEGDIPDPGTTVLVQTWIPLNKDDVFDFSVTKAVIGDNVSAKSRLDNISVFPNPYLGASSIERDKYQRRMRFTDLPQRATVRFFTLAGVFVRKLEKDDATAYLDWDLKNNVGLPVASGLYIAHIDMPGIGKKIMKLAIIQEQQVLDRIN